jgi:hypothetical protein
LVFILWNIGAGLLLVGTIAWVVLSIGMAVWLRRNDSIAQDLAAVHQSDMVSALGVHHQRDAQPALFLLRAAARQVRRYQMLHDPDQFLPALLAYRISVGSMVSGLGLLLCGLFLAT